MRIGSLFAGIGGLELGLERAGVGETVWQVEKDPYCRKVLAKHWPNATRYEDVTTTDWSTVEPVDLICGGFPCQPFSSAGDRRGTEDERWLWSSFARAICVLRPRFVVVENVANFHCFDAFGRVLHDLHDRGFDAEWSTVSACSVGAPHSRPRVFFIAYPHGEGKPLRPVDAEVAGLRAFAGAVWPEPDPRSVRVADGIPRRVDRARALGNAVVPQVAEVVGRRILELA